MVVPAGILRAICMRPNQSFPPKIKPYTPGVERLCLYLTDLFLLCSMFVLCHLILTCVIHHCFVDTEMHISARTSSADWNGCKKYGTNRRGGARR